MDPWIAPYRLTQPLPPPSHLLPSRYQARRLIKPGRMIEMPAQRISVLPRSCPASGPKSGSIRRVHRGVPALFDEMVRDGRMPPPVKFNSKKVWDREKLDQAFATHGEEEDNPFDAIAIRRSHGEAAAQIRRR